MGCSGVLGGLPEASDQASKLVLISPGGSIDVITKHHAFIQVDRAENINRDIPLATACKADAEKLCADKYEVGPVQACPYMCRSPSPCHACCLHAGSAV